MGRGTLFRGPVAVCTIYYYVLLLDPGLPAYTTDLIRVLLSLITHSKPARFKICTLQSKYNITCTCKYLARVHLNINNYCCAGCIFPNLWYRSNDECDRLLHCCLRSFLGLSKITRARISNQLCPFFDISPFQNCESAPTCSSNPQFYFSRRTGRYLTVV